jgi:hypothetical protein
VDGSSFDPNRKAKEEQAKAVEMAKKKYALVLLIHYMYCMYTSQNMASDDSKVHINNFKVIQGFFFFVCM